MGAIPSFSIKSYHIHPPNLPSQNTSLFGWRICGRICEAAELQIQGPPLIRSLAEIFLPRTPPDLLLGLQIHPRVDLLTTASPLSLANPGVFCTKLPLQIHPCCSPATAKTKTKTLVKKTGNQHIEKKSSNIKTQNELRDNFSI